MEPLLPDELRQAVSAASDGTVKVVDPATHQTFYVVTATVYERLHQALAGDGSVRDFERLLVDLAPEDWEDAGQYDPPAP